MRLQFYRAIGVVIFITLVNGCRSEQLADSSKRGDQEISTRVYELSHEKSKLFDELKREIGQNKNLNVLLSFGIGVSTWEDFKCEKNKNKLIVTCPKQGHDQIQEFIELLSNDYVKSYIADIQNNIDF